MSVSIRNISLFFSMILSVPGFAQDFETPDLARDMEPPGFVDDTDPLAFGAAGDGMALECLLEPFMSVKIGSPVPGALSAVMVSRGDVVKKDEPVARVDSRVQLAQVVMARERAAYTKRRMLRNQELAEQDLLSSQETDEMETDALMAELELNEQETQVEVRWIRSPFNGVVVERYKGPGEYVQQTEIMELAQINPLNVEVVVPVSFFGKIQPGMVVDVGLQEPVGGSYQAKVKVIDKVIDAASGTFGVRLEIPNPGNKIPAGLRCEARFEL